MFVACNTRDVIGYFVLQSPKESHQNTAVKPPHSGTPYPLYMYGNPYHGPVLYPAPIVYPPMSPCQGPDGKPLPPLRYPGTCISHLLYACCATCTYQVKHVYYIYSTCNIMWSSQTYVIGTCNTMLSSKTCTLLHVHFMHCSLTTLCINYQYFCDFDMNTCNCLLGFTKLM